MHFFGISTSKKWCVLYMLILFDFEICFAPQWRALFRHPNFREWSEREAPLVYSLANVLRATMACNRSSLIWLDGSAPAALASRLFWTSHKSLERHTNFIDFPTFSREPAASERMQALHAGRVGKPERSLMRNQVSLRIMTGAAN